MLAKLESLAQMQWMIFVGWMKCLNNLQSIKVSKIDNIGNQSYYHNTLPQLNVEKFYKDWYFGNFQLSIGKMNRIKTFFDTWESLQAIIEHWFHWLKKLLHIIGHLFPRDTHFVHCSYLNKTYTWLSIYTNYNYHI